MLHHSAGLFCHCRYHLLRRHNAPCMRVMRAAMLCAQNVSTAQRPRDASPVLAGMRLALLAGMELTPDMVNLVLLLAFLAWATTPPQDDTDTP